MTLLDQWRADGALFNPIDQDVFPWGGEPVICTIKVTGAIHTIPATIDDPIDALDEEQGCNVTTQVIQIREADPPEGILLPTTIASINVRGKRCTVTGITSPGNGSHELTLSVGGNA
jgi:hypothetical protein